MAEFHEKTNTAVCLTYLTVAVNLRIISAPVTDVKRFLFGFSGPGT